MLTEIPCVVMRGGTSKGPFFRREDLPENRETVSRILLAALGAPDGRQIDGIGGAQTVTSKVAIISRNPEGPSHVDYLFAQVEFERNYVDWGPTCGNMVIAVGPYAIEQGLVPVQGDKTSVIIHSINIDSTIEAVVPTPNGQVEYEGDWAIDGVPGTAAPILINFLDAVGSKTGRLLPTGKLRDTVQGIEVTCIDVAMPMVIARAVDMDKTGYESKSELDSDKGFFARLESIRREAGALMGMGDVSQSVTPKFAILAPPRNGGHVTSRYFVPHNLHPTHAVSGAICISSCLALSGAIADGIARPLEGDLPRVLVEHPAGTMEVALTLAYKDGQRTIDRAGVIRTARRLMSGRVAIPRRVWDGRTTAAK
jgi:2-methylaconitate cis-trans-isomerase PrpF